MLRRIILDFISTIIVIGLASIAVSCGSPDYMETDSDKEIPQTMQEEIKSIEIDPIEFFDHINTKPAEQVTETVEIITNPLPLITEQITETVTESITEPITEIVTEPITEQIIEPIQIEIITEAVTEPPKVLDRSKPLYEVYKDGYEIKVDTNLQWYIRDLSIEFGFIEKYLYGVIISESAFYYDVSNGSCIGLCQVDESWLQSPYVHHFTNDYAQRDLRNPYDNLITTMEIWDWAKNAWNLDLSTEEGMMKVIYFHSCGRSPRNITESWYFNLISGYADQLIPLQ